MAQEDTAPEDAAPEDIVQEKEAPPEPPALPRDLKIDFAPYSHYLKSRAKADLRRHSTKIASKLRGLNRGCPTCRRLGIVQVTVREAFYDAHNILVPAVYDTRTCPTCVGRKDLFNRRAASAFVSAALPPGGGRGRAAKQREIMRVLEESRRTYRKLPKMTYEIRGRYAVIDAKSGDGVFPLNFHMVPVRGKFAWYVHDPSLSGAFNMGGEFEGLPGAARVREVYAGDIIVIGRKRAVRLAGITIPNSKGVVLKKSQSIPDSRLRALVRQDLLGKEVELVTDKYAQFSNRGLPIAFVKIDGKDYGLELVRRGLARRHPKHKTQFNKLYMAAEKEARAQKVGCWKKLLK